MPYRNTSVCRFKALDPDPDHNRSTYYFLPSNYMLIKKLEACNYKAYLHAMDLLEG